MHIIYYKNKKTINFLFLKSREKILQNVIEKRMINWWQKAIKYGVIEMKKYILKKRFNPILRHIIEMKKKYSKKNVLTLFSATSI